MTNATVFHVIVMPRQGRERRGGQNVRHVLRRILVHPAPFLEEEKRDDDDVADLHRALGQQELRRALQASVSSPERAQEARDGLLIAVVL